MVLVAGRSRERYEKAERVRRIINYFRNLITKEVADETSPSERFYRYLPELARRDRMNLLANRIITEDQDIERGFKAASRFVFESRLGAEVVEILVGLIPATYAMTPNDPSPWLALPLTAVCVALSVDIVRVLFCAKAKIAQNPRAFDDE